MALARAIDVLFVDMGGVLLDTSRLAPQWRRLLGEFLSPRLGGAPEAWAKANVPAFDRSWNVRYREAVDATGGRGARAFWPEDARLWLADMCAEVGVPLLAPPRVDEIALAAQRYVAERVDAALPGAVPALRQLKDRGLRIHLAAAGWSPVLEAYLRGLGARELVDCPYGSDLVDTFKSGVHFYRAMLADARVDPSRAAVVDDYPSALDWARACGLRTYLLPARGELGCSDDRGHRVIESLTALASEV